MDRKLSNILVTGGAGFIGSNFIRFLLEDENFKGRIINFDSLTYAGNLSSLQDIDAKFAKDRYMFVQGDIRSPESLEKLFCENEIDTVIHFAAESHVDRSIVGPMSFIETNIVGTMNLLQVVRKHWQDRKDVLFHHISTDEVYGSLGDEGYFLETTSYDPRSPYSASKASSDHLVNAYFHTYDLPVITSNCSNNYGPFQFPEKLIPLMIDKIINEEPLPVYGDGKNIRDWLHVYDHNRAVWLIINHGKVGEVYNIGGEAELKNIDLVEQLCEVVADYTGRSDVDYKKLITFIKDRPGHDRRYAINCDKLKTELGWERKFNFKDGLKQTIEWYLDNKSWIENVKTGQYRNWLEQNYSKR